jgi:peptide/nickel transport system substrate-binding protein
MHDADPGRFNLGQSKCLVLLAVVAALTAALMAGCGSSSSSSGQSASGSGADFYTGGTQGGTPTRGGTVTIVSAEAPTSLDPVTVAPPGSSRPSVSIFDTLVELMPGSEEPQPALAESWKSSPDARAYTFHLRAGVEFSNGQVLTAEDVAFSLERVRDLPISTCAPFLGGLASVSAVGPSTVELKFSNPEPALIDLLSLPCFGVVPKSVVKEDGEKNFAEHPVGTGPFMVESTTPGYTKISLVRNPRFWREGKPYLDGLVYSQVENDNSRLLAVKAGSAQLAIGVPYSQVSAMEATPDVQMVIEPIWGAWINPINNTKPPLSDPIVRRALLYATPYQAIIDSIFKGRATQANSTIGKMQYWTPAVQPYPYNVAKARALLKEAHYPNGFHLTLEVQGGENNGELLASILQSAWSEVGIDVSINTLSSASLFANTFAGKFEMQIIPTESAVNETHTPDVPVNSYLSGELFPNLQPSAELKAALKKATTSTDEAERKRLFQEIQRQSYAVEPTWLPVINLSALNLASSSLRNYDVLLNGHSRMEEVWLAK